MIITNIYGLPDALVKMADEEYNVQPYEYRVTSLLKGYKEMMILRKHYDVITVDVSQMIWLLFGKAVHYILEQEEANEHELKEERLKMQFGKYTISGQFDLYSFDKRKITDYKSTSVWKIVHKSFDDWKRQGDIYSMLMLSYGFPVNEIEVVAFLKDHSPTKAKYEKDYPALPVHRVNFEITQQDIKNAEQFVNDRLSEIAVYETMAVNSIPACTPEERWQDDPTYAVMKEGKSRASKVEDTMEEAKKWINLKVKPSELSSVKIVERPGLNKKCINYCFAKEYCNFYQSLDEKEK